MPARDFIVAAWLSAGGSHDGLSVSFFDYGFRYCVVLFDGYGQERAL